MIDTVRAVVVFFLRMISRLRRGFSAPFWKIMPTIWIIALLVGPAEITFIRSQSTRGRLIRRQSGRRSLGAGFEVKADTDIDGLIYLPQVNTQKVSLC